MSLIFISSIIMMISFIFMILAAILSKKTIIDREKSSLFECGFDAKSSTWLTFFYVFF